MFKFHTIGQIEHLYAFEDAVAAADTFNGACGSVVSGTFTVGEQAKKAIMQIEEGDDMNMPTYKINKGEHVRVVDFEKLDGQTVEIYGDQLPSGVKKGDKLKSDANGALVSGADAAPYFEVTKVIGNKLGVEVTVVMA